MTTEITERRIAELEGAYRRSLEAAGVRGRARELMGIGFVEGLRAALAELSAPAT